MSRFVQCGIGQSHCAQVTWELCMHMVTMIRTTVLSFPALVSVLCYSPTVVICHALAYAQLWFSPKTC